MRCVFTVNSDLPSVGACNPAPVTLLSPCQLEALGTAQGCLGLRRPGFLAPTLLARLPGGRQAGVCLA